jgi:hypothetical protein
VIERHDSREEHFTEGEPDLEPPEELAVLEVDEEAQLEEDLDNRADLEDEVDEDVLETSLDHLVHDGDDDDFEDGDATGDAPSPVATIARLVGDVADGDDLEIEDLEDREESLDRILREKLAGDEEAGAYADEVAADRGLISAGDATGAVPPVADFDVLSCGPDEFVCTTCFLVRHRVQRAGVSGSRCQDCSE